MPFFTLLLGLAFSLVSLLLVRPPARPPVNTPDQQIPDSGEGDPMRLIFGSRRVTPSIVWSGDLRTRPIIVEVDKK